MWVKSLSDSTEIVANDLCRLRELLHPDHDGVQVGYSLAHARIEPGARTIRHHLENASEVYYLLKGRGTMHIDNEEREVTAGDAILIPAGAVQNLVNTGEEPIEFLAIVEPAWQPEIDHRDEEA
jgi:mannose-6-phosphate isomerase-like protein (cupin superfamily)